MRRFNCFCAGNLGPNNANFPFFVRLTRHVVLFTAVLAQRAPLVPLCFVCARRFLSSHCLATANRSSVAPQLWKFGLACLQGRRSSVRSTSEWAHLQLYPSTLEHHNTGNLQQPGHSLQTCAAPRNRESQICITQQINKSTRKADAGTYTKCTD